MFTFCLDMSFHILFRHEFITDSDPSVNTPVFRIRMVFMQMRIHIQMRFPIKLVNSLNVIYAKNSKWIGNVVWWKKYTQEEDCQRKDYWFSWNWDLIFAAQKEKKIQLIHQAPSDKKKTFFLQSSWCRVGRIRIRI